MSCPPYLNMIGHVLFIKFIGHLSSFLIICFVIQLFVIVIFRWLFVPFKINYLELSLIVQRASVRCFFANLFSILFSFMLDFIDYYSAKGQSMDYLVVFLESKEP